MGGELGAPDYGCLAFMTGAADLPPLLRTRPPARGKEDSALAAAGGRSERTHSQAEPCPHGSPLGSTVQFLQRFRRKVAQHRPKALAAISNLSGAGTERRRHLSSAYRLSRGHFQPWESHERALGGGGCGAFGDWKAAWLRRGSGTGALKDSERLSA